MTIGAPPIWLLAATDIDNFAARRSGVTSHLGLGDYPNSSLLDRFEIRLETRQGRRVFPDGFFRVVPEILAGFGFQQFQRLNAGKTGLVVLENFDKRIVAG